VQLAWTASNATGIAGYRLYYGNRSRNYAQAFGSGVQVGNSTQFTVSGLPVGTTYYFSVTAVDTAGNESAYSNEAIKLVQ
jgi:fibronectin type 3 domain-containing protein